MLQELGVNKELIEKGDGDSSDGSDSAPSEDNLPTTELNKCLPEEEKLKKPKPQPPPKSPDRRAVRN